MKADWELVPDDAALERLTGVSAPQEWAAVAVPSIERPSAILTAVWMQDAVWAAIDIRGPIMPVTFCRAVKAFHGILKETGVTRCLGIRAAHVHPRWMEWLGAVRTGDMIEGEEVWQWQN
jgi:hypothetical protein